MIESSGGPVGSTSQTQPVCPAGLNSTFPPAICSSGPVVLAHATAGPAFKLVYRPVNAHSGSILYSTSAGTYVVACTLPASDNHPRLASPDLPTFSGQDCTRALPVNHLMKISVEEIGLHIPSILAFFKATRSKPGTCGGFRQPARPNPRVRWRELAQSSNPVST